MLKQNYHEYDKPLHPTLGRGSLKTGRFQSNSDSFMTHVSPSAWCRRATTLRRKVVWVMVGRLWLWCVPPIYSCRINVVLRREESTEREKSARACVWTVIAVLVFVRQVSFFSPCTYSLNRCSCCTFSIDWDWNIVFSMEKHAIFFVSVTEIKEV